LNEKELTNLLNKIAGSGNLSMPISGTGTKSNPFIIPAKIPASMIPMLNNSIPVPNQKKVSNWILIFVMCD